MPSNRKSLDEGGNASASASNPRPGRAGRPSTIKEHGDGVLAGPLGDLPSCVYVHVGLQGIRMKVLASFKMID